jgi:hypothetical protein
MPLASSRLLARRLLNTTQQFNPAFQPSLDLRAFPGTTARALSQVHSSWGFAQVDLNQLDGATPNGITQGVRNAVFMINALLKNLATHKDQTRYQELLNFLPANWNQDSEATPSIASNIPSELATFSPQDLLRVAVVLFGSASYWLSRGITYLSLQFLKLGEGEFMGLSLVFGFSSGFSGYCLGIREICLCQLGALVVGNAALDHHSGQRPH